MSQTRAGHHWSDLTVRGVHRRTAQDKFSAARFAETFGGQKERREKLQRLAGLGGNDFRSRSPGRQSFRTVPLNTLLI